MTEWCVQHPSTGDWVPVGDLLTDVYRIGQETAASVDSAEALLADLDTRVDSQRAALDALTERVALLEELPARLDALKSAFDTLAARVAGLERSTGPQYGVDVSGHQSLEQVQAAATDPRNAFVIVKATEGMSGRNADYSAQRAATGSKFLGAYHFAWSNQDPLKEAANFLAGAALKPGEVAFLDVENWGTGPHPTPEMQATSWAQRVTFALAWLDEVKAKTGGTPVLYANWDWIKNLRTAATAAQWTRLTAYPLWLADYSGTGGKHSTVTSKDGSNPDSWPIRLHQYLVNDLDRNWTPDIAALRACAVTK